MAHAEKWEKEAKEAWEREFDLEDRLERGGQHVPRMAICESKDRAMHKLMVERDRYEEKLVASLKDNQLDQERGNCGSSSLLEQAPGWRSEGRGGVGAGASSGGRRGCLRY